MKRVKRKKAKVKVAKPRVGKISAKKKQKKIGKRQLKAYREMLLKEKERITGEIQHINKDTLNRSQRDASGDISGYTYHMADVATDSYDREFSLGLANNEREILYEVNEALKKVEDGSYGNCLECAKPITKKRLKAVPYTKFCIKCQSILETNKKPI